VPPPGDPRAGIRIADILHMSSGLRIRAPQDPDYDPSGPYPDHLYLYTGGVNSFHYAATRPPQWPPNTIGRYRNTDPVLINYLIRLGVEKRGEEYLSFPQRALFDKIGIRTMVMETDPYGNFLGQGYELASARDWARLGMLYLQDGVWNGDRILPAGYAKFVSTLAPAWKADNRPIYGAFSLSLTRHRQPPLECANAFRQFSATVISGKPSNSWSSLTRAEADWISDCSLAFSRCVGRQALRCRSSDVFEIS